MQGNNYQSNADRASTVWGRNPTLDEYYDKLLYYIFIRDDLNDLVDAIKDPNEGRYYYGVMGITWFLEIGVIKDRDIIQKK